MIKQKVSSRENGITAFNALIEKEKIPKENIISISEDDGFVTMWYVDK